MLNRALGRRTKGGNLLNLEVSSLFPEVPLQVYAKVFQKTITWDSLNIFSGDEESWKFIRKNIWRYSEGCCMLKKYLLENKGYR